MYVKCCLLNISSVIQAFMCLDIIHHFIHLLFLIYFIVYLFIITRLWLSSRPSRHSKPRVVMIPTSSWCQPVVPSETTKSASWQLSVPVGMCTEVVWLGFDVRRHWVSSHGADITVNCSAAVWTNTLNLRVRSVEIVQWNLSITTTSIMKFIYCDLFSNMF